MIDRNDPAEYLAALNDSPAGSCLTCFIEWKLQVQEALNNPAVNNGMRAELSRLLIELNACIDNINNSIPDSFINDQKIKAQNAINELGL